MEPIDSLEIHLLNKGQKYRIRYRRNGRPGGAEVLMTARFMDADETMTWWGQRPKFGTTQVPVDWIVQISIG